jgi:mRNA-degrading endonuclease toxin of MazEF toxin-antitoxin module
MHKDFDTWNNLKKEIHAMGRTIFCDPREIWWCAMGLNIGSEEDGKNDLFERPVLIIRVFNRHMVRIVPLTSKVKDDENHHLLIYGGVTNSARLSHLKTISPLRLTRKIGKIDTAQFKSIVEKLKTQIT